MNKTRQWAALTAVACLAVLAAGWLVVVKPQRSHAHSLRTQAAQVLSSNNQLRSQVDQLRQQQRDLPVQQKLLSQIATKIPDNPALPSLIRQLSAAADGAGVDLVSLAPSAPTVPSTTGAAGAAGAGATAARSSTATVGTHVTAGAQTLATIPIAVQVTGSYFNIEQFFSAVESLNRAMLVTGFSLAPGGGSAAASAPTTGSTAAATPTTPGALTAQITAAVFEVPQVTAAPAALASPSTPVH